MNSKRPYFLWDYDLTETDVRRILRGQNETEKLWMMGRILASANFKDIWKYLSLKEIMLNLPKLRLRPEIKNAWNNAVYVWTNNVPS
ncbi:MAG: hypothetical protein AAB838_00700 [Patescibacteria group bacterium]